MKSHSKKKEKRDKFWKDEEASRRWVRRGRNESSFARIFGREAGKSLNGSPSSRPLTAARPKYLWVFYARCRPRVAFIELSSAEDFRRTSVHIVRALATTVYCPRPTRLQIIDNFYPVLLALPLFSCFAANNSKLGWILISLDDWQCSLHIF